MFDSASPSSAEREHIERVRSFMRKSEEYRRPHANLAASSRSLYQSWLSSGRSPTFRANIRLPYAFGIIESEVPQIVEALFGERPFVTLEASAIQDMMWEDPLTDFLDTQVEAMRLPQRAVSFVKAALLDGTAIAKVPWRRIQQTFKTPQVVEQEDGTFKVEVKSEKKTTFDGPDFEQIAFTDFFPHWSMREAGNIQDMPGVAMRTWKTLSQLEASDYGNIDKLKASLDAHKDRDGMESSAWASPYFQDNGDAQRATRQNDNQFENKNRGTIEVWEYWGLAKINGKPQQAVITIANGDVVMRAIANPTDSQFKPFVCAVNVPRTDEFYGVPEIVPVQGILNEANILRNASLDQVNMSIYRMFLLDRTAGIEEQNLVFRPFGLIPTNDINGIVPLPVPQVDPSAFAEVSNIQQEAKDALGVVAGSAQVGQAAKTFGRTATGTQYINSITASRVALKVKLLGEMMLKPLYGMMVKWNAQFTTDEKWVRSTNPNSQNPFTILPPEAWESAASFKAKVNYDTGGSDAIQGKLQSLMQIATTAEQTQPGIFRWDIFWQQFGRAIMGPRYAKIMRTPEEMQEMQQQRMQMEAQAQAQAAGQPGQGAQTGAPQAQAAQAQAGDLASLVASAGSNVPGAAQ